MKTIRQISETKVEIDGVFYIKEKEPNPEFKYWAKWGETDELFFITKRTEGKLWGNFSDGSYIYIRKRDCSIPTKEEIELHLKKICEEKYIGKRVKGLVNSCYEGIVTNKCLIGPYFSDSDDYWMCLENDKGICVYKQGKFAEIIPDKKPLPKTKEEFEKFLDDYAWVEPPPANFLDQYE